MLSVDLIVAVSDLLVQYWARKIENIFGPGLLAAAGPPKPGGGWFGPPSPEW
jgi:hypothetical protein